MLLYLKRKGKITSEGFARVNYEQVRACDVS